MVQKPSKIGQNHENDHVWTNICNRKRFKKGQEVYIYENRWPKTNNESNKLKKIKLSLFHEKKSKLNFFGNVSFGRQTSYSVAQHYKKLCQISARMKKNAFSQQNLI